MYIDAQNLLSDKQSLISGIGTVVSTNTIDLGANTVDHFNQTVPKDVGKSKFAEFLCQITTACVGVGASIQAQLIESANANLSSPNVIQSTAAIPVASLVAGYQFRLEMPPGIVQRYLGVQYVITGAAITAGAVMAGPVLDKQTTFVG